MSYYEELTGNLPDFAQGSAIIDQGVCRKACAEVDRLRLALAATESLVARIARDRDKWMESAEVRCRLLSQARDEAEKAKAERDEPVKGPRAQYEISDRQIKRMSDDWDEAKNYESCMAGPASAFGFGWRMSASRSPSSDAWNDLVAKLDSLKAFVQTIAQEKGEYGRYGYNQPTHRALEAQALLAAVSAARADAARKEPPAKAHGCEVGE